MTLMDLILDLFRLRESNRNHALTSKMQTGPRANLIGPDRLIRRGKAVGAPTWHKLARRGAADGAETSPQDGQIRDRTRRREGVDENGVGL